MLCSETRCDGDPCRRAGVSICTFVTSPTNHISSLLIPRRLQHIGAANQISKVHDFTLPPG